VIIHPNSNVWSKQKYNAAVRLLTSMKHFTIGPINHTEVAEIDYFDCMSWPDGIFIEFEEKKKVPANYLDVFSSCHNRELRMEDNRMRWKRHSVRKDLPQ
jgi:hypothetical protein